MNSRCNACRQPLSATARFCKHCGARVTVEQAIPSTPIRPEPSSAPRRPVPAPAQATASVAVTAPTGDPSSDVSPRTCVACGHIMPTATGYCQACGAAMQSRVTPAGRQPYLPIDRLRDPGEQSAMITLIVLGAPLVIGLLILIVMTAGTFLIPIIFGVLFAVLMAWLTGSIYAASIKVNGIRVSEMQFPEIQRIVIESSRKLGITPPEVFLYREVNLFNAFAARLARKRYVILEPELVDSILLKGDYRQLAFIIGHEIGHHAAGHTAWWQGFLRLGAWVPAVWLWYSRRCELTCDRIGLYCAGSLQSSLTAVSNMIAGAQMAGQVNPHAAIRQWHEHRGELLVHYQTIYSTHPSHLWRYSELTDAARAFGIPE